MFLIVVVGVVFVFFFLSNILMVLRYVIKIDLGELFIKKKNFVFELDMKFIFI